MRIIGNQTKMNTYWRLLGFARPLGKYAIPYFFYTLMHAFFNVFTMMMLMPTLDTLLNKSGTIEMVTEVPKFALNMDYVSNAMNYLVYLCFGPDYGLYQVLIVLAIVTIIASFLSNLFRYLGQRTMENLRITSLQRIRNTIFDNVMGLDVGFFSNERKGDIISKISSDVEVVRFCITSTLQVAFREPFLIIAYILALVMISWKLTVFAVLFLPVVTFTIGIIVKRLKRKATRAQETFADMVSTVDESITGVKIIKAYNATDYVKDKYHKINALYSRISRSMARRQQLSSPISEFLGISAIAILLLFGGHLVLGGDIKGTEFFAYLGIFSQLTRPVRALADAFTNINQGLAAGERIMDLADTKSAIVDKPDAIEMGGFREGIEFRNVSFSYDNREVIGGVSFKVKKGETVALVGPSGGGKTTLSDLIPRFYDVQAGEIIIDGHDIRDYTIGSLRGHMGVVAQETILFNDTIENNIRMGKRDASFEEIEAAAKVANAHSFILETEDGYQTNIGDRGMKLSGGQRQRLSIARAVLKNPEILILDEATSALDTESEKLVQDALNVLLEGRTSVVIAHRLSTINNADRIVVVEDGHIVEKGTHDQLIKKKGLYCKLVEMQHMS